MHRLSSSDPLRQELPKLIEHCDTALKTLADHVLTIFRNFKLLASQVKPYTPKRYIQAYFNFISSIPSLPRTVSELDQRLLRDVEMSYQKNPSPGKRPEMINLVAHVCFVAPDLRTRLGLARKTLESWNRFTGNRSLLPLTRHFLLAFVARLKEQRFLESAVALAVVWAAYLRATELLALCKRDVALPEDSRL